MEAQPHWLMLVRLGIIKHLQRDVVRTVPTPDDYLVLHVEEVHKNPERDLPMRRPGTLF
jgi:hypothetical protein